MDNKPRLLAFFDRATIQVWRALSSPYADVVLGAVGVCLSIGWGLVSFIREPLAGVALHTLAQAVWEVRALRAMAVCLGALACWRLISLLVPGWVPPPRQRSTASENSRLHLERFPSPEFWRSADFALCRMVLTPQGRLMVLQKRRGLSRLNILLPLGLFLFWGATGLQAGLGAYSAPSPLLLGHQQPLLPGEKTSATLDELYVTAKGGSVDWLEALLTVRQGDHIVGISHLRERQPWVTGRVTLFVAGHGPAVRLCAFGAQGESEERLLLSPLANGQGPQTVVRLAFAGQQEHQVALPSHNLIVRLVYYPPEIGGAGQGALWHAQALSGRDGQVLAEGFTQDRPLHLNVGQVRVVSVPEYYILLGAERRVAQPLFAVGAICILTGLAARFLWPPRFVWLAVRQEGEAWLGEVRATDLALVNAVHRIVGDER